MTKGTHGGARPGSGPKRKPPELLMRDVSLKMRPDQIAKFHRLGGAKWIRARIDRAKE